MRTKLIPILIVFIVGFSGLVTLVNLVAVSSGLAPSSQSNTASFNYQSESYYINAGTINSGTVTLNSIVASSYQALNLNNAGSWSESAGSSSDTFTWSQNLGSFSYYSGTHIELALYAEMPSYYNSGVYSHNLASVQGKLSIDGTNLVFASYNPGYAGSGSGTAVKWFEYGAAAIPSVPTGDYSVTLTITATTSYTLYSMNNGLYTDFNQQNQVAESTQPKQSAASFMDGYTFNGASVTTPALAVPGNLAAWDITYSTSAGNLGVSSSGYQYSGFASSIKFSGTSSTSLSQSSWSISYTTINAVERRTVGTLPSSVTSTATISQSVNWFNSTSYSWSGLNDPSGALNGASVDGKNWDTLISYSISNLLETGYGASANQFYVNGNLKDVSTSNNYYAFSGALTDAFSISLQTQDFVTYTISGTPNPPNYAAIVQSPVTFSISYSSPIAISQVDLYIGGSLMDRYTSPSSSGDISYPFTDPSFSPETVSWYFTTGEYSQYFNLTYGGATTPAENSSNIIVLQSASATHSYPITLSGVPQEGQVPITITNSQSSPTGVYQQLINFPTSTYKNSINANFSDVYFSYQNGTTIPSWIQSNASNTYSSTPIWMKLNSIPASSSITVYAHIVPNSVFFGQGWANIGEYPTATSIYGQNDNGYEVFPAINGLPAYWNFNGTSLPYGWAVGSGINLTYTVSDGVNITGDVTQYASINTMLSPTVYSNYPQNVAFLTYARSTNYGRVGVNGYNGLYNGYQNYFTHSNGYLQWTTDSYVYTSLSPYSSTSQTMHYFGISGSNTATTTGSIDGWSSALTNTLQTQPTQEINFYLGGSSQPPNMFIQWALVRTQPTNNVMPSVIFDSLQSSNDTTQYYQQLITVSNPQSYGLNSANSNFQITTSSGSPLYTWIQSYNSTTLTMWTKTPYSVSGSETLQMEVMPSFENLFSANGYLGTSPTLSRTTDNGYMVFDSENSYYNNFGNSSSLSNWSGGAFSNNNLGVASNGLNLSGGDIGMTSNQQFNFNNAWYITDGYFGVGSSYGRAGWGYVPGSNQAHLSGNSHYKGIFTNSTSYAASTGTYTISDNSPYIFTIYYDYTANIGYLYIGNIQETASIHGYFNQPQSLGFQENSGSGFFNYVVVANVPNNVMPTASISGSGSAFMANATTTSSFPGIMGAPVNSTYQNMIYNIPISPSTVYLTAIINSTWQFSVLYPSTYEVEGNMVLFTNLSGFTSIGIETVQPSLYIGQNTLISLSLDQEGPNNNTIGYQYYTYFSASVSYTPFGSNTRVNLEPGSLSFYLPYGSHATVTVYDYFHNQVGQASFLVPQNDFTLNMALNVTLLYAINNQTQGTFVSMGLRSGASNLTFPDPMYVANGTSYEWYITALDPQTYQDVLYSGTVQATGQTYTIPVPVGVPISSLIVEAQAYNGSGIDQLTNAGPASGDPTAYLYINNVRTYFGQSFEGTLGETVSIKITDVLGHPLFSTFLTLNSPLMSEKFNITTPSYLIQFVNQENVNASSPLATQYSSIKVANTTGPYYNFTTHVGLWSQVYLAAGYTYFLSTHDNLTATRYIDLTNETIAYAFNGSNIQPMTESQYQNATATLSLKVDGGLKGEIQVNTTNVFTLTVYFAKGSALYTLNAQQTASVMANLSAEVDLNGNFYGHLTPYYISPGVIGMKVNESTLQSGFNVNISISDTLIDGSMVHGKASEQFGTVNYNPSNPPQPITGFDIQKFLESPAVIIVGLISAVLGIIAWLRPKIRAKHQREENDLNQATLVVEGGIALKILGEQPLTPLEQAWWNAIPQETRKKLMNEGTAGQRSFFPRFKPKIFPGREGKVK